MILAIDGYSPNDSIVVLRDAQTGLEQWRAPSPNVFGERLAFSLNGKTLVQLGAQLRAFDVVTSRVRWTRSENTSVSQAVTPLN